jgi:hypothetical protein
MSYPPTMRHSRRAGELGGLKRNRHALSNAT